MKMQTKTPSQGFNKQYSVAIDTVPLPENPEERIRLVVDQEKRGQRTIVSNIGKK